MPPENEAAPSVADSLTAAFDAATETPTAAPASESGPVGAVDESAPAPAEKPPLEGRDSAGKFTKKAYSTPVEAPVPDAKTDAPAAVPASGAVPATPAAAAPLAADAAPQSWHDGIKAKWAGLDPEVKAEIGRREREITVGLQRAAETRKFGDSIAQEFAPYAEILAKEGASPQAAIRALLETSYALRYGSQQHKHALFLSLAEQYGIDLSQQVDPDKARLEWELDSRKHGDLRSEAQQQEQIRRDVGTELGAFINAPGHEHYEAVRTAMAGLLSTGVTNDLQDAYDRACWADPAIRASLQQAADLQRVAAQTKNRAALGTVTGAPGAVNSGAPAVSPKNLRAVIESQFGGGRV